MRKSGTRSLFVIVIIALANPSFINQARSQQFGQQTDPRPVLSALIKAFQTCGPPNVYQYLGVQLFQTIAQQTGGMGCYGGIAAAGAITQMQVNNVAQLPAGPVFAVRVTHQSGIVADWYIGLSNWTGRVEYLTFVAANANTPLPDVKRPPGDGEIAQPQVVAKADASNDCKAYKTMCL